MLGRKSDTTEDENPRHVKTLIIYRAFYKGKIVCSFGLDIDHLLLVWGYSCGGGLASPGVNTIGARLLWCKQTTPQLLWWFTLEHWGHRSNMETTGVSWADHFHGVMISCLRLQRFSTGIQSRFWGWADSSRVPRPLFLSNLIWVGEGEKAAWYSLHGW